MCSNGLPSENKAANTSFMWHDESPMFPNPTKTFRIAYDRQILVDLSHPSSIHWETHDEVADHGSFLHCQEIEKPISAVCMGCWRAKVKCDRQSPCSRCTRKGLECTPQLRRRGRPRAENGFSCGGSSSPTSSQVNVSSEDASGTQSKIRVTQNGSTISRDAGGICRQGSVCMGCWRAKVKCDRLSPCSRCVRKGMDCTPHIPVRLRKAQAAALGTAFNHAASREQAEALHAASKALNHAASLFSAVPKIEPKMISAPAHSASDEDEEAASALLGLFGGISSDAAAPDDAVAQRHQTCKRPRDDEEPIGIITMRLCDEVAVDFDADKMRMLKRPVKPFPARRSTEFGSAAKGPWQLQSGQMLPPPLPPTSQLQCVG